jgi:hypothetical protein
MIYLSGKSNISLRHPRLGFMRALGDTRPNPRGHCPLAADNGCFTRPTLYSDRAYAKFLSTMPRPRMLFATARDVLGDHEATVKLAIPGLRLIRSLGIPAAFVAQDGWQEESTPWDEFDVLFVGGSTEFKFRGGRDAVLAAKRHNKWCHMGRVNSLDRLRAAAGIGCNSADGTFIAFGPDKRGPEVLRWLDALKAQPELPI